MAQEFLKLGLTQKCFFSPLLLQIRTYVFGFGFLVFNSDLTQLTFCPPRFDYWNSLPEKKLDVWF